MMYTDTTLMGADTDLEELLVTLKTPWKTMDSDMNSALGIMTNHAKYVRRSGGCACLQIKYSKSV